MKQFALRARKASCIALCAAGLILSPFVPAKARSAGDAENGRKIFDNLSCSRCHGADGEGMTPGEKESGPPKIARTPLSVQQFIVLVRAPKGAMPSFGARQVSDAELLDVYAFLQSPAAQPKLELPASASSENGQRFYKSFGCYECHGLVGQGSTQTGGSRLGPPQIPFSGFVAYARHPNGQMPPYSSKVVSDAQFADIYAFLQSIPRPAPSSSIPLLNQ